MPRNHRKTLAQSLVLATLLSPVAAENVIVQYFESKWDTIERRMPDVFLARYQAIWTPPPGRADSGGFSVGYDVFDRFDFGNPFSPTLYGTEQSFDRLSAEMNRAGIQLHIDSVLNHNGFSDANRPGFEENGGYPGFVTRIPQDIDGDFHGAFESGDLNGRLAGLIDIAQEKNHVFIRHPAVPGNPLNIPNETPRFSNRRFYPDTNFNDPPELGDTSGDRRTPSGFNLDNPEAGDPVPENAKDLLYRYIKWMVEVKGVDGYRLDAQKHIPTWFFSVDGFQDYDDSLFNIGRNPIDGSPFTPFSYGEIFTGDIGVLASYVRKDGYGNRDALDFPLFFAMENVFGAGGFGNMRNLEFASFDRWDGNVNTGSANDGTFGVMFAGSHDSFGAGSFTGLNNVANAHVLTRTGYPLVYYNAQEFGTGRDFPKGGRGDALGNFGNTITTLVRINKEYMRGRHITRWVDDDIYIYERQNNAIIALSDRMDSGFDTRGIDTSFAPGTVLVELTGNASNPTVDPNNDIPETITVAQDGRIGIRVPRNRTGDTTHGLGYVVYGPAKPLSTLAITNSVDTLGPDPADGRPEAVRRLAVLPVVTADTINVELTVNATATAPNDNAMIKVNFGEVDVDGDGSRNASGPFAGFESFTGLPGGSTTATRVYTASIDATQLKEGYTYLETAAFLQRAVGSPAIYDNQRVVVYLDRLPPEQELLFPPRTGVADITSKDYEVVIGVDHTVNAVHIMRNLDPGLDDAAVLALVSGENAARRHDRLEYRRVLNDLSDGPLALTVVAFEETGNYSIVRYDNIAVDIPSPEILIGIDTNPDPNAVNFVNAPATTNSPAFPQEFVIRVRTVDIDGLGRNITFPEDFTVTLQVDNDPVLNAVPFNQELLPPIGRLVQNDQDIADEFDEFRFLWRGYTRGNHTFRATAALTDLSEPPNEALLEIEVLPTAPGPGVLITKPQPPGETVDNPDSITVEGSFTNALGVSARVFIDLTEGPSLVANLGTPSVGPFSVSRIVDSYSKSDRLIPGSLALFNGTFPVRVVASTGPNGTGIVTEASSAYTITGVPALPGLAPLEIDGDATDLLGLPLLAASAADGGTGGTDPTDFGADGTLTQLHAGLRGDHLYIVVRGDMFGPDNDNTANVSILFIDVDAGSGTGATDIATQLTDETDGLRGDISRASFVLSSDLVSGGFGFDMAVGITAPGVGFGYSFGTGGLAGAFDLFEFLPGVSVAYDAGPITLPGAPGTTIDAPNAFEVSIPLAALGNPDISQLRFAVVTASDGGFPSPNTLPENSSNDFTAVQEIESLAQIPAPVSVLINEVYTGPFDAVELFNPNGVTVSIAGWNLVTRDSDGITTAFTIPTGTTIPAGGYFVIADAPGYDLETGYNIPWHQERGGSVALISPHGVGVDFVAWRDVTDNPSTDNAAVIPYGTAWANSVAGAASSTAGQSLGRSASSLDTDLADDWENTGGIDADGPTLGAVNSGGQPLPIEQRDLWMFY